MKEIPNSRVITITRTDASTIPFMSNVPFYYANSTFSIISTGDSPSSKRLYDSVLYGCIPIIISDRFYHLSSKISIRIPEKDYKTLPKVIKKISPKEILEFQRNLRDASDYIRFDNGIDGQNGVGSIFWDLYLRYFDKSKNNSV